MLRGRRLVAVLVNQLVELLQAKVGGALNTIALQD
jgi:hypothetical protein